MKLALAFAAIVAVASAQFGNFGQPQPARYVPRPVSSTPRPSYTPVSRPSSSDEAASILRYDNDQQPDGSFSYAVETDNGIAFNAQGTPRDFGGNPPVVPVVQSGAFSFNTPEGQPISISYIADENGYQPSGDAIPTPPPIPADILKALEYLAKNAPGQ